eukprot:TRINITY_DN22949_c0_g1_i1.p1 TRINITY_DN22949_c0_g1~~TRINITY_DN22949_c0_g1_i1.p1  ORF type:complete len:490 (+),score=120.41 TRINITY_DN22949_c0_g1_i1:28-1497(+)
MSATVAEKRRRDEEDGARKMVKTGAEDLSEMMKKRALQAKMMFVTYFGAEVRQDDAAKKLSVGLKLRRGYASTPDGAKPLITEKVTAKQADLKLLKSSGSPEPTTASAIPQPTAQGQLIVSGDKQKAEEIKKQQERAARKDSKDLVVLPMSGKELRSMHDKSMKRPQWHAPWKIHRVLPGHLGWVRCLAVDHSNEWFASSGADRTLKIWDLASGKLKLTLTGHISSVRGLAISSRSPYLFTCAEDGKVMCWDLEYNKVVRNYHGHLNGVYSLTLHPKLDILASGGRDASVRVWDIRTRAEIHCMTGHQGAVHCLTSAPDPYFISGSQDKQIKIWDIAEGRSVATLTHHKKGVRSLAYHPSEYTFASGSRDNIKKWKSPRGEFLDNFSGHESIVNTLSINQDGVMVSGGDDGALHFWDWKTGYNFQKMNTIAQPGSLEAETAIYCSTFDQSGSRLITGEADKTIKIWKEDETATEETHPIEWIPQKRKFF